MALLLWALLLAVFWLTTAGYQRADGHPAKILLAKPHDRPSNHRRCFIVKVRGDVPTAAMREMLGRPNGTEDRGVWDSAFHGFFHCAANETQLEVWANDSRVEYVEEDCRVRASAVQEVALLMGNLDRIDQRLLPLDGEFIYNYTGRGVYIYVVDTGVLSTHEQLVGRVKPGQSFVPDTAQNETTDCNGHGTHVSGTAAGTFTGVAKEATIVPVRVLGCNGEGSLISIINALNWISSSQPRPGVINLSLGTNTSSSLDAAVQNVILRGFHVVAAAGNGANDACQYSPAQVPTAITVGWTTSADWMHPQSSYGDCVDFFAPGSNIFSAWNISPKSYALLSGTSMSAALTSGVVAAYLQADTSTSPQAMQAYVTQMATANVLHGLGAKSPNLLLYSRGNLTSNSSSTSSSSTLVPSDGNNNSSSNTALYWILVVPGVLLLCTILFFIFFFVLRRRRRLQETELQAVHRAPAVMLELPSQHSPSWTPHSSPMVYGIPIMIGDPPPGTLPAMPLGTLPATPLASPWGPPHGFI